jgi:hypothetical protein
MPTPTWWKPNGRSPPIGNRELQSFAGTVRTKADWTRGLYVSNSCFSEDGLTAFRLGENTRIICLSGIDLRDVFTHNLSLVEVFDLKTRRAGELDGAMSLYGNS